MSSGTGEVGIIVVPIAIAAPLTRNNPVKIPRDKNLMFEFINIL
jgi:hypothetical protein